MMLFVLTFSQIARRNLGHFLFIHCLKSGGIQILGAFFLNLSGIQGELGAAGLWGYTSGPAAGGAGNKKYFLF